MSELEFDACADLFNDPDYQCLVSHNGVPNLSLLGGPAADITPANLLNKCILKWAEEEQAEEEEEADESPGSRESASGAYSVGSGKPLPECWQTTCADLGVNQSDSSGPAVLGSVTTVAAESSRRRGETREGRRKKKSLKPSAEAVSMANTGRAMPSCMFLLCCFCSFAWHSAIGSFKEQTVGAKRQ